MKRIIILFLMIILGLNLGGCNVKLISQEQSLKNFDFYENQLNDAADFYNLTLGDLLANNSEYGLYHHYLITIDDVQSISIILTNNAHQSEKGREDVEIIYKNSDKTNAFNLELFVEIVNAVSGKEITKEYCEKFLSDPEEKHSPKRYGIEKDVNKKVFKYEFLNFGEDWSIGYSLYDDETEDLTFWGITKQMVN